MAPTSKDKEKATKEKGSKSGKDKQKPAEPESEEPLTPAPTPTPKDTPSRRSVMPVTQAAISTFFGDGKEDRGKTGKKESETKSLEAVIRALETKMRQMVTPEYLEKEFKKLITDDLSKKLGKLRDDLKKHFQEELSKVNHRVAELETKIKDNETEIESLKNDNSDLQTKVQELEDNYKNLKIEKDKMADKVNETEQIVKL